MNIFSTDLFPHIEGSMLRENRVTMHIHNVNMKNMEGRDGDSIKTEVWLKERKKSALLNKTETRKLAMVYGPETDEWIGKPIVLYGEFGRWFGKEQWALRVDDVATIKALKKHKPAKAKAATPADVEAANDLFGLPTSGPVEQTEIPWDDDLLGGDEEG